MGSSPDEEDVERVDTDYVDPSSTTQSEIEADLRDAGIEGNSLDAFASRMLTDDDVEAAAESRDGLVLREDVEAAVDTADKPHAEGREAAIVEQASQDLGAPTDSEMRKARAKLAQSVDESGTLRTDPSLDPLAGPDGREIGKVSDVTENTGGRGGGFTQGVEPTGRGKGTYFVEDDEGNRYPLAEVDL